MAGDNATSLESSDGGNTEGFYHSPNSAVAGGSHPTPPESLDPHLTPGIQVRFLSLLGGEETKKRQASCQTQWP